MSRSILLMLLLLSFAGSASAALQRYVASEHESRWFTSSSRLYCSLSHEIPIYGKAVFERHATGTLGMRLEVKRQPREVGVARLVSRAPSWKHEARDRDLGQVSYRAERTPFMLRQIESRRLLSELEQGMFPTLSYQDWSDGRDEVQVSLSAVNIRASLGEFLDCLAMQLPYSFDHVKESKVYFAFDSSLLDSTARRRLDELADYLLADESVSGVAMYGRTDSRGVRSYNDVLARRRAEAVRDYLLKRGVSADKFTIKLRSFGESRPVASNRTAAGRALNRMVEVSLLQ
ncbi:MAG: OmpA family protein [Gammaproteobacteria bacterium]|nr:OmpA family protein [Gammaproteobacteria bacterium]